MSYLYKRSNRLWHLLIRHRMTARVWRPLVEWTRQRHVRFRGELERAESILQEPTQTLPIPSPLRAGSIVSAGV
jgi:hypothetical protein